jgi:deoxyribodipyrimidine photolyase-related protein
MTTLRLILGDQLNARHSWFRDRRDDIVYVLMEVRSETDYVRHHAQKVLAIFAAMRGFAEALVKAGHRVVYLTLGDARNRQSFGDNLAWLVAEHRADVIERIEADEWRVEQQLAAAIAALGITSRVASAEHFLIERDEVVERFADRIPRMEYFYRDMRKRYGWLMDAAGAPLGGKWNYDADNRARWPGTPPAPDWPWSTHDLRTLWQELVGAGVATLGEPRADAVRWPLSRREAQQGLQHFICHALPHFGEFQDAMSTASTRLFHSGLSFALNVKLLHPREVIEAAVAAFETGRVSLASCEGFVRQILGWREYVRGIYWARMPGYASLNALGAVRPLPRWYWDGNTRMRCLAHAIGQSLDLAYAHHIQRLMLTGNFALLAGIAPDEVDAWYLGIYIDAFEWVEMPNTRGMSLFADGGQLASKPYAGAASYIGKQSDYCRGCHYDPKRRHGEGTCPFNSLYWDFLHRHQALFARNPRMAMPYKAWARMAEPERLATLQQAQLYLQQVDTL